MSTAATNFDLPYMGQSLAIDKELAFEALSTHLADMSLIRSGVSAKEVYKGRKEAQAATVFHLSEGGEIHAAPFTAENIETRKGLFAHLKLSGVMRMEDGLCSYGIGTLVEQIQKANANPNIAGILFEVNSGGGEATAGQALNLAIKDSKKPVVSFVRNAGSAALMGILHSKAIVMAGAQARIGSIGVFTAYNRKMVEAIKEQVTFVYSATSPDKNAAERQLVYTGDHSLLQQQINKADSLFEREVSKALQLKGDEDMQRETLNGGFFYANDGVRRGLANSVGSFKTAVNALVKEVNAATRINTKVKSDMGLMTELKALISNAEAAEKNEEVKPESNATEVSLSDVAERLAQIEAQVTTVVESLQTLTTTTTEAVSKIETVAGDVDEVKADISQAKEEITAIQESQVQLEENQLKLEGKAADGKAKSVVEKGNGVADVSATEKAFKKTFKAKMPEAIED